MGWGITEKLIDEATKREKRHLYDGYHVSTGDYIFFSFTDPRKAYNFGSRALEIIKDNGAVSAESPIALNSNRANNGKLNPYVLVVSVDVHGKIDYFGAVVNMLQRIMRAAKKLNVENKRPIMLGEYMVDALTMCNIPEAWATFAIPHIQDHLILADAPGSMLKAELLRPTAPGRVRRPAERLKGKRGYMLMLCASELGPIEVCSRGKGNTKFGSEWDIRKNNVKRITIPRDVCNTCYLPGTQSITK